MRYSTAPGLPQKNSCFHTHTHTHSQTVNLTFSRLRTQTCEAWGLPKRRQPGGSGSLQTPPGRKAWKPDLQEASCCFLQRCACRQNPSPGIHRLCTPQELCLWSVQCSYDLIACCRLLFSPDIGPYQTPADGNQNEFSYIIRQLQLWPDKVSSLEVNRGYTVRFKHKHAIKTWISCEVCGSYNHAHSFWVSCQSHKSDSDADAFTKTW